MVILLASQALQVHAAFNFVRMWGEPGGGPGQLSNMGWAMPMDSEESIYIITGGSQKIQKFDKFGNVLGEWDTYGDGEGEPLGGLQGLAVNTQDQVIASDQVNNLVHIFNSDGTFVRSISREFDPENESEYMCSLFGITTDSSDNIYVVDSCHNGILKFSSTGDYLGFWSVWEDEDAKNIAISYLDTDSADNVYVVDYNNNIVKKYTSDGNFILEWGVAGSGEGEFNGPRGIAIDDLGNVYISDPSNGYRIQKFNANGDFIDILSGPNGIGDDEFINPSALAVDNQGHLYIHDTIRVKVYLDTDAAPASPTPTPTDTPTVTPTQSPTSTPAPSVTQVTRKPTSKVRSPRPPVCGSFAPTSSPDLYQIDVTDTTANLYFVPVTGHVNHYIVSYGYWSGDERFGTSISQGHSNGAIAYTINHLEPDTTYHFKVRGGNGCMPGNWGNTIRIKTNKQGAKSTSSFYKNVIDKVFSTF